MTDVQPQIEMGSARWRKRNNHQPKMNLTPSINPSRTPPAKKQQLPAPKTPSPTPYCSLNLPATSTEKVLPQAHPNCKDPSTPSSQRKSSKLFHQASPCVSTRGDWRALSTTAPQSWVTVLTGNPDTPKRGGDSIQSSPLLGSSNYNQEKERETIKSEEPKENDKATKVLPPHPADTEPLPRPIEDDDSVTDDDFSAEAKELSAQILDQLTQCHGPILLQDVISWVDDYMRMLSERQTPVKGYTHVLCHHYDPIHPEGPFDTVCNRVNTSRVGAKSLPIEISTAVELVGGNQFRTGWLPLIGLCSTPTIREALLYLFWKKKVFLRFEYQLHAHDPLRFLAPLPVLQTPRHLCHYERHRGCVSLTTRQSMSHAWYEFKGCSHKDISGDNGAACLTCGHLFTLHQQNYPQCPRPDTISFPSAAATHCTEFSPGHSIPFQDHTQDIRISRPYPPLHHHHQSTSPKRPPKTIFYFFECGSAPGSTISSRSVIESGQPWDSSLSMTCDQRNATQITSHRATNTTPPFSLSHQPQSTLP